MIAGPLLFATKLQRHSIRLPLRTLRLTYEARLTQRATARPSTLALGTVTACLQRATAAGLAWPLPEDLDDAALEARLFARRRQVHRGGETLFVTISARVRG
jgi:hypothetical protein